jgi:hypothetical protein
MKNVRKIGWIPAILLSSSFAITAVYAVAQLDGGHVPGHVPTSKGEQREDRYGK